MSRRKNKSTAKRLRREQGKRNKITRKEREKLSDKRFGYTSACLFFIGSGASFFHSTFAMLTIFLPIMLVIPVIDRISVGLFGKNFEYHSRYSGKTNSWSDIFLAIPLLITGLLPMFFIGELADCYHDSSFWDATFGLCKKT
jgi:hypothetical protein